MRAKTFLLAVALAMLVLPEAVTACTAQPYLPTATAFGTGWRPTVPTRWWEPLEVDLEPMAEIRSATFVGPRGSGVSIVAMRPDERRDALALTSAGFLLIGGGFLAGVPSIEGGRSTWSTPTCVYTAETDVGVDPFGLPVSGSLCELDDGVILVAIVRGEVNDLTEREASRWVVETIVEDARNKGCDV